MTQRILTIPVPRTTPLICVWIKTGAARQPLVCKWTSSAQCAAVGAAADAKEGGQWRLCA